MKNICNYLATLLVFLGATGSACSQSLVEQMLTYKVTAHYPDHTIYAHVKPSGNIKAISNREYYWFSGGQINMTQGGYSGKLLNGDFQDFYSNKNLKESGNFKGGLKSGAWKSWKESGVLEEEFHYDDGRKNGKYIKYDSLGKVIERGNYMNGLLHGNQITASGDSTITKYYRDGRITVKKTIVPKFIQKVLPAKSNHKVNLNN